MKKSILLAVLLLIAMILTGCGNSTLESVPDPIATITLNDGRAMRFELYVREAPNTVANFIELANARFYDGQSFYRIIPGVLIQSGDPKNNGTGSAGYCIQGEFSENGIENKLSHDRGTISMCRQSGYDTASSQFFIMQGSYKADYDGKYAAFGKAMDDDTLAVIDAIGSTAVDGNYSPVGIGTVKIATIRVETHGYTYEAAKIKSEE